jgi:hypothetical protein
MKVTARILSLAAEKKLSYSNIADQFFPGNEGLQFKYWYLLMRIKLLLTFCIFKVQKVKDNVQTNELMTYDVYYLQFLCIAC